MMAVYHNMLLRGLNSIYIQAPHVAPKDFKDFIGYSYCWYQLIDGQQILTFTVLIPSPYETI
jgi:hypothetical protein